MTLFDRTIFDKIEEQQTNPKAMSNTLNRKSILGEPREEAIAAIAHLYDGKPPYRHDELEVSGRKWREQFDRNVEEFLRNRQINAGGNTVQDCCAQPDPQDQIVRKSVEIDYLTKVRDSQAEIAERLVDTIASARIAINRIHSQHDQKEKRLRDICEKSTSDIGLRASNRDVANVIVELASRTADAEKTLSLIRQVIHEVLLGKFIYGNLYIGPATTGGDEFGLKPVEGSSPSNLRSVLQVLLDSVLITEKPENGPTPIEQLLSALRGQKQKYTPKTPEVSSEGYDLGLYHAENKAKLVNDGGAGSYRADANEPLEPAPGEDAAPPFCEVCGGPHYTVQCPGPRPASDQRDAGSC